ncbi:MAG: TraR/DksA C4-type zinc finger protein [Phycisphaerales bacterium JB039]
MAKKKTAKKSAGRTTRKATGQPSTAKKAAATKGVKKTAPKKSAKKTAKKSTAKTTKKAAAKKVSKKTTKKTTAKGSAESKAPAKEASKAEKPAKGAAPAKDSKSPQDAKGRKGITVVEKKRPSRPKAPPVQFPSSGGLLAPGSPMRKPLIPSGPKNVVDEPLAAETNGAGKSPFNKRQLQKFRTMLLDKRRELLGDITGLESEALKSADGSDPRLAEHLEDQSSDAVDQAVSLDLAAADRRLLRMIDEALQRIDQGTYGLCVVTGKPIREERLRELPWASLSIEAARAEERRQMGRI